VIVSTVFVLALHITLPRGRQFGVSTVVQSVSGPGVVHDVQQLVVGIRSARFRVRLFNSQNAVVCLEV